VRRVSQKGNKDSKCRERMKTFALVTRTIIIILLAVMAWGNWLGFIDYDTSKLDVVGIVAMLIWCEVVLIREALDAQD